MTSTGAHSTWVHSTWAAFARTGKADNAAIPHWPAYSVTERVTMILDRDCRVVNDYGGEAPRL